MADREVRILVVDDDAGVVDWLVESLQAEHYRAEGTTDPRAALQRLTRERFDVVVSDVEMPGLRGVELLKAVQAARPGQVVILITAFGSIELAVQSVRAGAADFLAKPFRIEALTLSIDRALREKRLRREIVRLRESANRRAPGDLVAHSPAMRRALDLATRAASSALPVLITGESGTGKGVMARYLHQQSGRSGQFLQLNCAALPATLVEAELFGVRRGAFTDAREDRPGIFEQANGGTLFLDEVGEMPLETQPKLLQALESGKVRPIGAATEQAVDVRIVAATNRPLEDALRERRFRPDLYHRLNVVRIELPPLRERPEDIEPLLDQLLERSSRKAGREVLAISDEAKRWIRAHSWPGNVRELANAVERAVALSDRETLTLEDFERGGASFGPSLLDEAAGRQWSLAELEWAYIQRVLQQTGGNKARAAKVLGLDRRTLYRKLAEANGEPPEGENGEAC